MHTLVPDPPWRKLPSGPPDPGEALRLRVALRVALLMLSRRPGSAPPGSVPAHYVVAVERTMLASLDVSGETTQTVLECARRSGVQPPHVREARRALVQSGRWTCTDYRPSATMADGRRAPMGGARGYRPQVVPQPPPSQRRSAAAFDARLVEPSQRGGGPRPLRAIARLVLYAVIEHGPMCWASREALARTASLTMEQWKEGARILESRGLLASTPIYPGTPMPTGHGRARRRSTLREPRVQQYVDRLSRAGEGMDLGAPIEKSRGPVGGVGLGAPMTGARRPDDWGSAPRSLLIDPISDPKTEPTTTADTGPSVDREAGAASPSSSGGSPRQQAREIAAAAAVVLKQAPRNETEHTLRSIDAAIDRHGFEVLRKAMVQLDGARNPFFAGGTWSVASVFARELVVARVVDRWTRSDEGRVGRADRPSVARSDVRPRPIGSDMHGPPVSAAEISKAFESLLATNKTVSAPRDYASPATSPVGSGPGAPRTAPACLVDASAAAQAPAGVASSADASTRRVAVPAGRRPASRSPPDDDGMEPAALGVARLLDSLAVPTPRPRRSHDR